MRETFDYIVVGAGSAGCVLAERLSRDPQKRVLILEAGGSDRNPLVHIPLGAHALQGGKLDWCYKTNPEPELNNRSIAWPRGKVIGGSSSINGMLYVRGNPSDYDTWAAAGWSYQDLLPYFRQHEANARGVNEYHGGAGPIWVEDVEDLFETSDLFIRAAEKSGIPFNRDFNGDTQEGVGYYQVNIKRGLRQSSATTHLKAARKRKNLRLLSRAAVQRVIFEDDRAVGVEFRRGNRTRRAYSVCEVILCGGAINSPQILELSGIGQSARLEGMGIDSRLDLPGVGENLQDHLTVNVCQEVIGSKTYYDELKPRRFLHHVLRYAIQRRGLMALPAAQVGAFFRTTEIKEQPDAQIHFAPACAEYTSNHTMVPRPGITASVCFLKPTSRGSVHIQSADPETPPSIKANYLATEEDRQAMLAALKKTRKIFECSQFQKDGGRELTPGGSATTDRDLLDYIRKDAVSVYHPCGTCKMGAGPEAVVDNRLRVRGVRCLRVADASIMPRIISGNTHAACVVIAEKCADMIIEDQGK
ncbi:MAG: GMC oxidoreductase [Haliea sp.]|nr:GMC oxidoreductase [Haliea sp.]